MSWGWSQNYIIPKLLMSMFILKLLKPDNKFGTASQHPKKYIIK